MELLKNITCIWVLATPFVLFSQDQVALRQAFSKSYTQESNNNFKGAIAELTAHYSETSYELNLRLGWLSFMAGSFTESINYYQKAIKIMPAATEPLWGIIRPYDKMENYTAVEQSYLSILKLDPKNSKANYLLGLLHYYKKDFINAKKYLDVSLNLYPFDYDSMLMSAWTNYFLGKVNEAKTLFNKVLLINPNDKSATEGLSLIK